MRVRIDREREERRRRTGWFARATIPVYCIGLTIHFSEEERYEPSPMSTSSRALPPSLWPTELRKYRVDRVGFSIAHQYLHQLEPDIRHAVLGNVGTMISFRIGAEDPPHMVREFAGYLEEIGLLQLPIIAFT